MNVIAFGASSSSQSINKTLATIAGNMLVEQSGSKATVEVLDLNDFEMPIFSSDREKENGIPELATQFFEKLGKADAIIISFAEHNGSYSAAYKNIFDWASRIDAKVFQGKPMLMLATSPGKGGAQSVLGSATASAPHFNGDLRASLSVPNFYGNVDADALTIKSESIAKELSTAVQKLL